MTPTTAKELFAAEKSRVAAEVEKIATAAVTEAGAFVKEEIARVVEAAPSPSEIAREVFELMKAELKGTTAADAPDVIIPPAPTAPVAG